MIIRTAKPADEPVIRELLSQLGYPDLTEPEVQDKMVQYSQPSYALLVAEEAGAVLGFIALHIISQLHHHGSLGRITAFCVDEKHRSRSIGREMLKHAESWFKSQGCERVEVTSNNRRTGAHRFYLNLGYDEPSRRFAKALTDP